MKRESSLLFLKVGRMGLGCLILLFSLSFTAWGQTEQPAPPQTVTEQPAAPEQTEAEPPLPEQPLPPPQTVLVRGRKIVYYEAGKGSVVILLHGLGADSHHWAANIEPLSQNFHVIALDQIGYGKSDKPVMRYTVGNFADYLHGFLEAVKIPKASLVGNSLGGWVALDFTIRHPETVEKLVLVDAAGLHPTSPLRRPKGGWTNVTPFNTHWFFDLMDANKQWATTDLGPHAFERHVKNGDSYTVASSVAEMITGREFEDKKLDKVHTPTLIIWGRDDMLIPLAMGEHFNKGIAGSQMIVIDGTGHIPMVGKPAEFNQAVQKFLM
jgi:pimeloyl-ACP methyl ester carboxylesterase